MMLLYYEKKVKTMMTHNSTKYQQRWQCIDTTTKRSNKHLMLIRLICVKSEQRQATVRMTDIVLVKSKC
jgi:hypothetical protein